MAVEYYLICNTCKEFIGLYKIRLLPDAPHPLPAEGIVLTKSDLETGLAAFKKSFEGALPEWIEAQLPFIDHFIEEHHSHEPILKDDYPDPLWYPGSPGYLAWKGKTDTFDQ